MSENQNEDDGSARESSYSSQSDQNSFILESEASSHIYILLSGAVEV